MNRNQASEGNEDFVLIWLELPFIEGPLPMSWRPAVPVSSSVFSPCPVVLGFPNNSYFQRAHIAVLLVATYCCQHCYQDSTQHCHQHSTLLGDGPSLLQIEGKVSQVTGDGGDYAKPSQESPEPGLSKYYCQTIVQGEKMS